MKKRHVKKFNTKKKDAFDMLGNSSDDYLFKPKKKKTKTEKIQIYMSSKSPILDIEKELREIYYDKTVTTSSAKRLKQAATDRGVKATMKQVEAFIIKQGAFKKTKTFKAPKEFNSIIAPHPSSNLQIDLMELEGKKYKNERY
jgi:hypothetical protein